MSSKLPLVIIASVFLLASCAQQAPPPAPTTGPQSAAPQPAAATQGATLKQIQDRGKLLCGTGKDLVGFAYLDEKGNYTGFDVDFCKAIAAAIFGDPNKVEYRPVTSVTRFTALQSGETDVLIRTTTHTLQRDAESGLFAPHTFFDGGGVLVRKDGGYKEFKDLDGASICTISGSTNERNIADAMAAAGAKYTPVLFDTSDQTFGAYEAGRCQAVATDKSALAGRRSTFKTPSDHVILDATMSKEPFSPVVRRGDDQWYLVVAWTVWATFAAEEYGISSANVDQIKATAATPDLKRLIGTEGEMGKKLGLSNDWVYNIVKTVGNYKEIYDRHFGPDTKLNLPRGLNKQWKDGGLIYAPPIR